LAFKNFYYPDQNLLFTIFFGVTTPVDFRQYAIEMVNQKKLSHGFSRVSDLTLARNLQKIPASNVKSVSEYKANSDVIQSNGGIIVSNSSHTDTLADKFIEESKIVGNIIETRRTIFQALEFYDLHHMSETLEKEFKTMSDYFPNNYL
jgi:hypothetical protein